MNVAPSVRPGCAAATKSTSGGGGLCRPQPAQSSPCGAACRGCRQCGQRSNAKKSSSRVRGGSEREALMDPFYTQRQDTAASLAWLSSLWRGRAYE